MQPNLAKKYHVKSISSLDMSFFLYLAEVPSPSQHFTCLNTVTYDVSTLTKYAHVLFPRLGYKFLKLLHISRTVIVAYQE